MNSIRVVMTTSSAKVYAERVGRILAYLKEQKIPQCEVEQRINYTSLSKAKNYNRYPQTVIEKLTREELYNLLLKEFGLMYDENTDSVVQLKGDIRKTRDESTLYYIMYYYAFLRQTVGKAIVKIINMNRVIMDYRLYEHWEGTCQVIENYTFMMMEKTGEVTPVQKLVCLFSGTKKTGRPILLGTYSTIKRDGIPAAGKILFERVYDKKSLNKKIKSETDPRIAFYLMNQVMVTETFTPNNLDDLHIWFKLVNRFAGQYYFFYPNASREVIRAEMIWYDDSRIELNFAKISYAGSAKPLDPHTLKLEISDEAGYSDILEARIVLFMNISKTLTNPFYNCVGISNALETASNSFTCLLIEKEVYDESPAEKIESQLEKIKCTNSLVSPASIKS